MLNFLIIYDILEFWDLEVSVRRAHDVQVESVKFNTCDVLVKIKMKSSVTKENWHQ